MTEDLKQFLMQSQGIIFQIGLCLVVIILAGVALRLMRRAVTKATSARGFSDRQTNIVQKLIITGVSVVAILLISNILGFGVQGVFVATSSFFAVVGIAFFAVWSILSNMTASVIIYLSFPYRIGDRVCVENDEKMTGVLKDITLFYIKIETDEGRVISIPANVAIQKTISIENAKKSPAYADAGNI